MAQPAAITKIKPEEQFAVLVIQLQYALPLWTQCERHAGILARSCKVGARNPATNPAASRAKLPKAAGVPPAGMDVSFSARF